MALNRIVVSGVILLLLLSSLSYPLTYPASSSLDRMISFQPSDLTIVVPDDYGTIQEAIDNAKEGYTIFVRSGVYNEQVSITKDNIALIGEDPKHTIIDSYNQGRPGFAVIYIGYASNVRISRFTIKYDFGEHGISLFRAENCSISSNIITKTGIAIRIHLSSGIKVTNNSIIGNGACFSLFETNRSVFHDNLMKDNQYLFHHLSFSNENLLYHNNFINSTKFFWIEDSVNVWDNGYPSGGNFWSDYNGSDIYNGPNQDLPGSDGIGDSPYVIDDNNMDRYPLMKPWQRTDIEKISVLHVSVFQQNEVERIVENVGASNLFQIEQVGLEEFNNGYPSQLSGYDVIIFGINDWGEVAGDRERRIQRLDELEIYVQNGGGIVWTHDTLELWWDYGDAIEIPAGINNTDIHNTNQKRVWYSSVEIIRDHEILHYPFEIGTVGDILEVQYTHTNGGDATTATIIMQGHDAKKQKEATSKNNFYLTVNKHGFGRVVLVEIGHSTIREETPSIFNIPPEQECKILVNSLVWAAGEKLPQREETTFRIWCTPTVEFGSYITIHGNLSKIPEKNYVVNIYYTSPNGTILSRSTIVAGGEQPDPTDYFKPDKVGRWFVVAEFVGTDQLQGCRSNSLEFEVVSGIIDAEIKAVQFASLGPFVAGDEIVVSVEIKNTGTVKWTFYVNFSVIDLGELTKWWHSLYESITLYPESSDTVQLKWKVGMSTPAGFYKVRIGVWKSESNGFLKVKLDEKEYSNIPFSILPDGYDYDALEWVNIIEAQKLIDETKKMGEVVIAVIDTGIDPDIWEYIEQNGGDIVLYVRPEKYYDWGWKWPWEWRWKWRYVIANEAEDPNVKDALGHGSAVVSVVFQAIPYAKIIVFDCTDDILPGIDPVKVLLSLKWINSSANEYDVDIITMSFVGNFQQNVLYLEEIRVLKKDYGITFFASSGNYDGEKELYPASFDEVISVGGIFDDPDGFLTYVTKMFNTSYSGYRVTDSVIKRYNEGPYALRKEYPSQTGSTYNEKIDFVAPFFDIEVLRFKEAGNQKGLTDVYVGWMDGTSFSAPIAASAAGLIIYAYYQKFGREPTPDLIYRALSETAETSVDQEQYTPKPITYGKVYEIKQKNRYVGWGCIDAFDAILYVTYAP